MHMYAQFVGETEREKTRCTENKVIDLPQFLACWDRLIFRYSFAARGLCTHGRLTTATRLSEVVCFGVSEGGLVLGLGCLGVLQLRSLLRSSGYSALRWSNCVP